MIHSTQSRWPSRAARYDRQISECIRPLTLSAVTGSCLLRPRKSLISSFIFRPQEKKEENSEQTTRAEP